MVPQPLSFLTFLKRTASYLGILQLGFLWYLLYQIKAVHVAQKFQGDATQNVLCIRGDSMKSLSFLTTLTLLSGLKMVSPL